MSEKTPAKKGSGTLNFALDFGPLLVFFLGYNFGGSKSDLTQGSMVGTAAFMVAISVAVVVSKWKLGRVSPMLWLSSILVIGFGSLTLWFRNFGFIQHKATAVYFLFSAVLIGSWLRSKPALKILLEQAYDGLDESGWLKLSLNWGLFFGALAGLNEVIIILLSESQYVTTKTFGLPALTFLFAMANIPMLMRHGLSLGDDKPENGNGDL
jgi:intracellular septation protein